MTKKEYKLPTIKILGNMKTITLGQGSTNNDGKGNSGS